MSDSQGLARKSDKEEKKEATSKSFWKNTRNNE
jgi:hypothetical protein